ncbi:phosphate ABC transporter permease subunit PstC [Dyella psychrodurans]|uniref:Phosphate transport system permease protein n=1 Tax=Dyella psychrodurans TaxID=1927960 RepID=A0A370XBP2_9GAMM|nr:phosphate ABC transporter permease subunit PstC [Dyella psychrodurans]RDS85722.1 phosphate ABC transporter permease subunit PstC [Dyella psychrodurans]
MQATSAEPLARDTEHRSRADARHDLIFRLLLRCCALFVLATLLGAALSTLWGGRDVLLKDGFHFLTSSDWNPVEDQYGALAPIAGTLITSLIALVIAVPISFGIALFLTEIAPNWLRGPVSAAIELLAGIPSIIYGMWGLFVFVPFMANIEPTLNDTLGNIPVIGALFQGPPLGLGLLTAGIVLAVMILPFISSVMREVFQTVPARLKESSYALGSTTWEVVWDIVLPYTRSAVIGGIFLGLGRALGETMAVTFVLGNSYNLTSSLLMPGTSISSSIANEFNEAVGLHRSALIALGFLLFVVTFIVLLIARLMLRQLARREGR